MWRARRGTALWLCVIVLNISRSLGESAREATPRQMFLETMTEEEHDHDVVVSGLPHMT